MDDSFKIGIELEYLWDPSTFQYASFTDLLISMDIISKSDVDEKTIPYREMFPKLIELLKHRFNFFNPTKDGDLLELVFPPYTFDELEEYRSKFNVLFNTFTSYGVKIHGDVPIGSHHSVDLDIFDEKSLRNFFHCVFALRKALYVIANRNGRSTRRSDLVHLIGDVHKVYMAEDHVRMFEVYLDNLINFYNERLNISLMSVTLYPKIKGKKKILFNLNGITQY
jgi:hypothetical protein